MQGLEKFSTPLRDLSPLPPDPVLGDQDGDRDIQGTHGEPVLCQGLKADHHGGHIRGCPGEEPVIVAAPVTQAAPVPAGGKAGDEGKGEHPPGDERSFFPRFRDAVGPGGEG